MMITKRYLNWLRYKLKNRGHITGLRFTATWKCDSRCVTCAIWKDQDAGKNDLRPEEIDRFSRSKYFRKTEYITISGGEPTLREDLPEVISILNRNIPGARFGITTHGMDPDLEERVFKKILKNNPGINFGLVGISLNGPPEIHEATRGIKGSWKKTVETYDRLKDLVHCEFSFTFCALNADYFDWVQDFAAKKGTRAYICWTVMNERFNVSDKDLVFWKSGMEKVLDRYLERSRSLPRNLLEKLVTVLTLPDSVTLGCLYDYIINRRIMPCFAGSQIVHIDPRGCVYPCNFKLTEDRILGRLREKSFDDIWESVPGKILKEIKNGECMYPNGLCGDSDIYPSICNSPPFVIKWYLKKIFKGRPLIELEKHGK
ncbi:MAG: radical SAM protein [Candidatus Omnitrophota bacterium]|nr:radical SAM protein [Candidatus Omnitrophota bacterium]